MCAPISVATGGAVSGCVVGGNHGILAAQITGLVALCGALVWNFRSWLGGLLKSRPAPG